jgi:hypothetical protein
MAYRELGVTTIREVLRRWLRKQPLRGIADTCHVDRKTVRRYLAAGRACGLTEDDDEAALTADVLGAVAKRVQVGAKVHVGGGYAACIDHHEQLFKWQREGAGGPKLVRLLQRKAGISVSLRTLQRFMQTELAKAKGPGATCHVADCSPGEELQVDYEQLGLVEDADAGTRRILHAFVCTAVHSRHCFLYPCWQETTESTIQALEAAWEFFGGVFAGVIPDNLKAVVIKPDPVQPVFNEVFLEYSQARGFLIGPARVRRPQDKGRVENCVKYTQSDFFAGETLTHLDDWRRAAALWCREQAGLRKHGTTGRQPLLHFEEVEQQALLPKPLSTWDIPRWTTAKVGRDNRIRVDNAFYRITAGLIGEELRVRVDRTTVRLAHKHSIIHAFVRVEAHQTGGLPCSSEASAQDSIASRSPERLQAQAAQYGAAVAEVARRLLGRGLWFSQVRKVLHLFKLCDLYGKSPVDSACAKLLAVDADDPVQVERVVKLGLETRVPAPVTKPAAAAAPGKYARDNHTWQKTPSLSQGEQHVT